LHNYANFVVFPPATWQVEKGICCVEMERGHDRIIKHVFKLVYDALFTQTNFTNIADFISIYHVYKYNKSTVLFLKTHKS